jgi:hypothetical protein
MSQVDSKIYEQILRYVQSNPVAGDTVEGITKWWLQDMCPITHVKEALDKLVAEGLIFEVRTSDSHPIYKGRVSRQ